MATLREVKLVKANNESYLETIANIQDHVLGGDWSIVKVNFGSVGTLDTHFLFWWTVCNTTKITLNNESGHFILSGAVLLHNWDLAED